MTSMLIFAGGAASLIYSAAAELIYGAEKLTVHRRGRPA